MEYFRIKQDRRFLNPPHITNMEEIIKRRKDVSIQNASQIEDVSVGFSDIKNTVDFIDVLDSQLFLISYNVKKVFTIYEPSMVFKEICILNSCTDEYSRYFIPLLPEINCISGKSIISPDRTYVKHVVLKQFHKNISIFKAEGLMTDVVVIRLDVAESLLRRGIRKLILEPLEVEAEI